MVSALGALGEPGHTLEGPAVSLRPSASWLGGWCHLPVPGAHSVVSDSLWPRGLCDPPGSSVLGILQGRILEWVAIPSPGDLPDPGIELTSLTSPALAGRFFTPSYLGSPDIKIQCCRVKVLLSLLRMQENISTCRIRNSFVGGSTSSDLGLKMIRI